MSHRWQVMRTVKFLVPTGPDTSKWRHLIVVFFFWTPPFLAHAATDALFWYMAHVHGYGWLDALSRSRWDSGHYLRIAAGGYRMEPCPPFAVVTDDPDSWC